MLLLIPFSILLLSSVLDSRESLLFCERALYSEIESLKKETTLKDAVKFTDICPEVRQRTSANLNKWLDILLALMVQFGAHSPPSV
jgi:hypothetical protein